MHVGMSREFKHNTCTQLIIHITSASLEEHAFKQANNLFPFTRKKFNHQIVCQKVLKYPVYHWQYLYIISLPFETQNKNMEQFNYRK